MGAHGGDHTVVQNDDHVRILHRGHTLGNDQLGGTRDFLPEGLADAGIGGRIQAFGRAPFDFGPFVGEYVEAMIEVSIRQIYGWAAYACLLLVLLFLLYKFPVRSTLKRIPYWKQVGRATRRWLGAAGR